MGRGAAEAGRVSSAGCWQGPGVATLIRCFPGEPGLPEPWRAVLGRVGGGGPAPLSASLGPAYLGAGQRPQSTGWSWTQSRRAGAGPRGADQPRLGCWLGGRYLGTGVGGKGQTGRGPGEGWPTGRPESTATYRQSLRDARRTLGKKRGAPGFTEYLPGSPENWGGGAQAGLRPHDPPRSLHTLCPLSTPPCEHSQTLPGGQRG